MDCPRCDGPVIEFSLGETIAPVCEQCGHVNIETDLSAIIEPVEPWEESLRRFQER